MTVIINLDKLLKEKKLTASALSIKTGICYQQLSNIRRKETTKISLDTIEKLVKGLDCTFNDLFLFIKSTTNEKVGK